jgi:hypothetical protein
MAETVQADVTQAELEALGLVWPPTQDELPYDDGMPMESQRHVMQLQLLMDPLRLLWEGRQDVYIGGNMFVYYSLAQVRNKDFRGPDFFVALDVPKRERKSWVIWEEGKGPDVVIELLSASTAAQDKGETGRLLKQHGANEAALANAIQAVRGNETVHNARPTRSTFNGRTFPENIPSLRPALDERDLVFQNVRFRDLPSIIRHHWRIDSV